MDKTAYISLKSGREVEIEEFKYITYPSESSSESMKKIETFDDFYLYPRFLTFVGKSDILTLDSSDIEFIKFYNVAKN